MNAKPAIVALLAAALTLLLLSGCGPKERIVSVPCAQRADNPPDPGPAKPLTGNASVDVIILAERLLAWKEVAITRGALLEGCFA